MLKPEHCDSTRQHANECRFIGKQKRSFLCPDSNVIEMICAQTKQFIAKRNQNSSMKIIARLCNQKGYGRI